jgi:hypothetical protein
MADVQNTYAGNRIQNREDLSDIIAELSPMDAPIYDKLEKGKATNVYHEYLTQEQTRGAGATAYAEGAAAGSATNLTPTRNVNYVESIEAPYQVSREQNIVDAVGGSELSKQRRYAMESWKTKMEFELIWGSGVSGTSGTARIMKGFLTLLSASTNASGTSLTESKLNSYVQNVWENSTGGTMMLFADSGLKRTISENFVTSTTKNLEASKARKLTTMIEVYESDFGIVEMYPHRDLAGSNRMFMFRDNAAKLAIFDAPHIEELSRDGYFEKEAIFGAGTLELNFPKAGISVANVIAG